MARIRNGLRHLLAPVTRTAWFRRWGPKVLPPLERTLSRVTAGRLQVSGILVPSLVLHTTGAKSGQARDSVLMYTPESTSSGIVAGTSFARDRHPAWSSNLLAHPAAEVSVRGVRRPVTATPVPDADRDAVWRRIEQQWPGYRGYERDSGRVVRLFRLVGAPGTFRP